MINIWNTPDAITNGKAAGARRIFISILIG